MLNFKLKTCEDIKKKVVKLSIFTAQLSLRIENICSLGKFIFKLSVVIKSEIVYCMFGPRGWGKTLRGSACSEERVV